MQIKFLLKVQFLPRLWEREAEKMHTSIKPITLIESLALIFPKAHRIFSIHLIRSHG